MKLDIIKTSLLSLLFLFVLSGSANSQFTRFGGGLSFSTGIEDVNHKTGNPGLNVRGILELGDRLWLKPAISFYMPGKRQFSTTMFGTFDLDATYTLATENTILFYALAGGNVSYLRSSFDNGETPSTFMPALNVGTGIEMIVEKDINGFAQVKGVIGSYKQYIAITIGVHYYFTGRRYRSW